MEPPSPSPTSAGAPAWRRTASLLFGLDEPVTRRTYLLAGLTLVALKFALDTLVVMAFTGRLWSPLGYLIPSLAMRDKMLGDNVPTSMHATLALVALPFLWVGLSMSVRRAADAGRSPWLGIGFLVPIVNYLVIAALALLPSSAQPQWTAPAGPYRPNPTAPDAPPLSRDLSASVLAVLASIAAGILMTGLSVYGLRTYGAALFFFTPFAMGALNTTLYARRSPRTLPATLALSAIGVVLTGLAILLFALEGVVCLLMAMPIALVCSLFGSLVAWAILRHNRGPTAQAVGSFLLLLPGFAGFEAKVAQPTVREVVTTIEIDAPPERVWQNVVSFSELPPPPEWFFRLGIAYPMRARIEGSGVGAVRHCEFSTGPFVEPITRWDAPRRLSFDVRSQPPSMKELSPYRHVNAPHLEGYMVSRRGEFRLTALPNGRTRLEGSTWYSLSIFPERYWVVGAEWLLHSIHGRVLRHIKHLSEG